MSISFGLNFLGLFLHQPMDAFDELRERFDRDLNFAPYLTDSLSGLCGCVVK